MSRAPKLVRAAATVGGYTMASRVLGFVRDLLIAAFLGAGPVADVFLVAFRLPNMFRRLFAEGAFSAAFVPMFSSRLEGEGESAALRFAEEALAVLLAVLLVFTALAELCMPVLVLVLAPGFADQPEKFDLAVHLSRLMFPYLLFMALMALFAGILNTFRRFAVPAAAPMLLNVFMIGGLLAGAHWTGAPGEALAWAVAAAGAAQLALVLRDMRRAGLHVRLRLPRITPGVRRLFALLVPGVLGAGALQINILVGTMIASLLPTGAVAFLHYADRIYQLPLGVVGIAIGTVLLPGLSRAIRAGEDASGQLGRAVEIAMLLALPATAALLSMPEAVVAVLFERGAFSPEDTRRTAAALAAFAAGLPAFILAKVLQPGFFAREDTRTPFRVTVFGLLVNTVLSLVLSRFLGHVGIAAATSAAAWLSTGTLWWLLHRRGHWRADRRLARSLTGSAAASALMAAALLVGLDAADALLGGGEAERAAALAGLCVLGAFAFAVSALALGAVRPTDIRSLAGRVRRGSPSPAD